MADAAAYAACVLVLAGCCAYALSVREGRELAACLLRVAAIRALIACTLVRILAVRIRGGVLQARWAWRCRRHPPLPDHETIPEPERS